MARPIRIRKVTNPPHFKGFRPIDILCDHAPVVINFEEYESIRLSDYELFTQEEAAKLMNISRSTYTRIYENARRKVAKAFVLGTAIVFEGGKVYFNSEWYLCENCGCRFNHPAKNEKVENCSLCGSVNIQQCETDTANDVVAIVCFCDYCGKEIDHFPGVPCKQALCPDCNHPLRNKC
jgi:predicted DNA-binding protein (UPF0251 family)